MILDDILKILKSNSNSIAYEIGEIIKIKNLW